MSPFSLIFVFFPTKTVEIRWNWRCKIFSLKIRRCKFLDKFHVCASAPERGRYRSLQCWRHCSTAHNRPPKIGSDKDHRGFNPCISNVKCLNSAIFSLHGGMIFGPIGLLHWGKFGNKLPEQTKFKRSGLSVSRQVLNCRLNIEIFLSSTLNDSPHHRLRTPWRWLCLVWNLIDGWLSLVVWIYQRGSLWMIIISK